MINDSILIQMLSSDKFDPPYEAIAEIIRQKKISDQVLLHILSLKDKLVLGDFLENFIYLSDEQLNPVKKFIEQHINDKNHLFVSSLIDCANVNGFMSFYEDFLKIIQKRRNDLVVLSALNYIFDNMQFYKIKKIVKVFRRVINNKSYYQNCQTVAAFYLFRMTYDETYLIFLKELVLELDDRNAIVLKNCLDMECNHKKHFSYHDKLIAIANKRMKNTH